MYCTCEGLLRSALNAAASGGGQQCLPTRRKVVEEDACRSSARKTRAAPELDELGDELITDAMAGVGRQLQCRRRRRHIGAAAGSQKLRRRNRRIGPVGVRRVHRNWLCNGWGRISVNSDLRLYMNVAGT